MDPEQHVSVVFATSVEDISFGEELLFESEGDSRPSRFVFAQLPTGQYVIAGREIDVVGNFFEYVVLGDDTRIVAYQVLRTVKWTTGENWYYAQFATDADFFSCISCFSAAFDYQGVQEYRAIQEVVRLEGSLSNSLRAVGSTNTILHDGIPHDGIPHDGIPHDGIPHDGIPHDGIPHDGVPKLDDVHGDSDRRTLRHPPDCSDQTTHLGPVLFGAAVGIVLGYLMGRK
ncbi:uncharacterized protein B0H18DRAFT_1044848 [Fomitopsis serialis]|uniref:uncharacterized protein n=1 Tax=Fomitopsis serialis TaxID=139415 RepID=UPI002007CA90|nr:uncharacterized protein B0H18DRAFT_1044848 [Neoantrodia serialis]KAH9914575.1 hypothetical protein B0H18DRAFT_1044848 [Neoantrodia serialis]